MSVGFAFVFVLGFFVSWFNLACILYTCACYMKICNFELVAGCRASRFKVSIIIAVMAENCMVSTFY